MIGWAVCLPASCLPFSPSRLRACSRQRRAVVQCLGSTIVMVVGNSLRTPLTIAASRGGCFPLAVRRLPARPVSCCHPRWGGREEERRAAVAALRGVAGDGDSSPAARRRLRHNAARCYPAVVGGDREPVAMRATPWGFPDNPRRPPLLMLLCGVPIPMLSSRRREERKTLMRKSSARIPPALSSILWRGRNRVARDVG